VTGGDPAAWFARVAATRPAPASPLLPALHWGGHRVLWQPEPCVSCHGPAHMINEDGLPQHKVCAERELVATHGTSRAIELAGAGAGRTRHRDGAR
jgi:hypothetical protein